MNNKKKFWRISHASSDSREFAWASGYGLLDGENPYLPANLLASKLESERLFPRQPGLTITNSSPRSKAEKWPDFLGHGGGAPSYFLSETVVGDLQAYGVPTARITEMPIAEIDTKGLRSLPPPKYFIVETLPGIEIDFLASKIPTDEKGIPILNPLPKPWPPIWVLKASSWKGNDLFSFSNFSNSLTMICTEKIIDISRHQNWSNCRFEPIYAI